MRYTACACRGEIEVGSVWTRLVGAMGTGLGRVRLGPWPRIHFQLEGFCQGDGPLGQGPDSMCLGGGVMNNK